MATCRACCTRSTARSTRSTARTCRTAARAGARGRARARRRVRFNVAIGLVGLANIFDPALIAIAGGLVNDGDLFLEPIPRHFLGHIEGRDYRPTPEIVPAQLGERAGVIGAAMLALDAPRVRRTTEGRREGRAHAPVVHRGSRDAARASRPRPRRRASTASSSTTTCSASAATARCARRWSASRCSARWRPRRRASRSARSSCARRCGRRRRSRPRSTPCVRIAGPRLVVGLGAGDEESRSEMETFGLPMGTEADRVKRLRASLREIADRPYPAWVGGRARHVGLVAAESADGWNRWGRESGGRSRSRRPRSPRSWSGSTRTRRRSPRAGAGSSCSTPTTTRRRRRPQRLGAGDGRDRRWAADRARRRSPATATPARDWVILGPVDSEDPDNAHDPRRGAAPACADASGVRR